MLANRCDCSVDLSVERGRRLDTVPALLLVLIILVNEREHTLEPSQQVLRELALNCCARFAVRGEFFEFRENRSITVLLGQVGGETCQVFLDLTEGCAELGRSEVPA
jgi:hypothetical protein